MKQLLSDIREDTHWFCPLPFNHVYSNSDGYWMPCCHADKTVLDDGTKMNTENTSIFEWWNSDTLNGIRDEMLGISKESRYCDKFCKQCKLQEKNEGISSRQKWSNELLKGELFPNRFHSTILAAADYLENNKMHFEDYSGRYLDLKLRIFGNLCNLSCYMCWPHNSTTRIKDIKKLNDNQKKFWFGKEPPQPISNVNEDKFTQSLEDIKSIAHLISTLKITGGEPMIMKNHYRLLDTLIATGNASEIVLKYQSNLTKFDKSIDNFIEYSKQFKHVSISVSIDSFGEYDEYIRKNGDAQLVKQNLLKIKRIPNVSVGIANTVSMLSVLNHSEFNELYKHDYPIDYFVLTQPDMLNIKNLPNKIKRRLLKETKEPHIKEMLKQPRDEKQFQQALKYCLDLDILYGRNKGLFTLWPELEMYYDNIQSS